MNKRTEVLLGSGNYYHWEFNMRMTLARKGLLGHIMAVKEEKDVTEAWLVNDAKALGIIAQGVEIQHQTKIRSATRAMEAWGTLRDFYNRSTLHNRVVMTRRLHEFKMESGTSMAEHLDSFDELVVGLQTTGEQIDESRQLVVLLSSLPSEYDLISSIVENARDISLIEVKEKLLKESEKLQRKEATEKAFRVNGNGNARRFKGGRDNGRKGGPPRNNGGFKGKCFNCDQFGHMKRNCPAGKRFNSDDTVFAVGKGKSSGWLIDSGATSHMTPHRKDLFEYKGLEASIEVTIADGKKLLVKGAGTVKLTGLNGMRIRMVEVLHIPGLDRRLLSVGKLAERGMSVEFSRSSCVIWNKKQAIASGTKVGKSYFLDCEQEEACLVEYTGADNQWELWHARMGHPSKDALIRTQRLTNGIPIIKQSVEKLCAGCLKGKQTITVFPSRSMTKTTRVLERVHTDVMGPMRTISKGGAKYILTFVDDFSRYVAIFLIKSKSEVAGKFKEFLTLYENQWGARLRCLRSDNGTEFVNKKMAGICQENGIVHQRSVPYSPQQNGVAERMNRTIMEKARSMLHYKSVSTEWWAEAVNTAVYLINRSSNTVHPDTTPYELVFKMKPRMDHLRVFGSQGYAHIDDVKRTKLEPKSFKCMFLGYAENVKGYRVFDLENAKIKVTRSVKLDEREVGGIYDTQELKPETIVQVVKDGDEVNIQHQVDRQSVPDDPMGAVEETVEDVNMEDVNRTPSAVVQRLMPSESPVRNGLELTEYHQPSQVQQEDRLVFRPELERTRVRREPVLMLRNGSDGGESTKGSEGPPTPKRARIDEDGLIAEAFLAYAVNIDDDMDSPTTYTQAMASDDAMKWREAMDAELRSHEENKTWTLQPRGEIGRTIGSRWVFAKKRDQNGAIVRYKARLVAKGFKQKYGVDFFETYSPVANMNSIRIILAVCVECGYQMEQLDVDTAFLNSVLTDNVFMEVPLGVDNAQGNICQLNKAIYGLKQAASAWNKTIHRVFIRNGFKSCGADQCVYVKRTKEGFAYVGLYVDDMIIAARSSKELNQVKGVLKNAFKMKELGQAEFILGMEIDHDRSAGILMIKQTRYIDDVVKRFGQQDAKSVENPCVSGLKLSSKQSPTTEEGRSTMRSKPYRSLIGCLLYITTCTRPDIAYVVTQLSRFLENPGLQHWSAAIRVVRYLKTTRQIGIVYRGTGSVTVKAYSDADWGSNTDDRRSVSGIMVMIASAPVVFKSKYQRTVALSSAEAEYMALSLCTQEVLWTRAMLKDMGHEQVEGTQVWEDNQGAIALANNAGYHARTKHVDIKHHFIRENVQEGLLKIEYIDTKSQLADMLTKAVGTKMLKYLREATGIKTKSATKDTQH